MPSVTVGRRTIPYEVRESRRARRMRMEVTPAGVDVIVPEGTGEGKGAGVFLDQGGDFSIGEAPLSRQFLRGGFFANEKIDQLKAILSLCRGVRCCIWLSLSRSATMLKAKVMAQNWWLCSRSRITGG